VTPLARLPRRTLFVSAILFLGTGCQQLPALTRKRTGVGDPRQAVNSYFSLVTESRYDEAKRLLTASFQAQLGPSRVQSFLHSISAAQVTDIVDAIAWANGLGAHLPAPPSDRREYLVTLRVDPSASGASTWSNGTNRRFVDVVELGGGWEIDAIDVSPGSLITGKAAAASTPATWVLPNAAPRLGPAPVDRAIYTARQNAADRGQVPWAVDPLAVLHRDGPSFGISPSDRTNLAGADQDPTTLVPRVRVKVQHSDQELIVTLIQPIRTGPGGVWAIASIELAPL
jgi:hypothetical protein